MRAKKVYQALSAFVIVTRIGERDANLAAIFSEGPHINLQTVLVRSVRLVALEIVEHLLNSVFILEHKAKSLKTVIENYEEFKELIAECVNKTMPSQAVSIGALLSTHRRRVGNNVDAFETLLKADIEAGAIPFLSLAQMENVNGKNVQLYSVVVDVEIDEEELLF